MMEKWVCVEASEQEYPKLQDELNRLSEEGYEILTVLPRGSERGWKTYDIIAHRPDWKENPGGTD